MLKSVSLRPLVAAASTVCAIALLTASEGGLTASRRAGIRPFETLCRLFADPHDVFTRVVPPFEVGAAARASATLATINVNYAGFTAEAQTAFRVAVDIWSTQLNSSVPIVVDAQLFDMGNPIFLGQAGFRSLHFDFPGAPLAGVLYAGPIANRLSGVDRNGAQTELVVQLNSAANWNFATDGVPVAGKVDFITAVMHELTHGFGHAGSGTVSSSTGLGAWGFSGGPLVYDIFVADSVNNSILNGSKYPNGSVVLASLLKGTGIAGPGLFWTGANGIAGAGGVRPRIYAPPTFVAGSSYQHLDDATYPAGNLNSLMTPALNTAEVIHTPGGITNGMLADMGWGTQCSFGLSQTIATIGAAGGNVSTTLSTTTGCPWTMSTASAFATIAPPLFGNASRVVTIAVAPNAAPSPRLATIFIADQTLTISQAGTVPCTYSLNPTSATVAGAGGSGTVNLLTSDAACAWTASATPSQAQITSATSGLGPATIGYTVSANPTCADRPVTLTIAGQPFVITQGPAPPLMTLDTTSMRFGAVATGAAFTSQTGPQIARIIQNGTGNVTWTAVSGSPWLVVSPASGTGGATLTLSVQRVAGLTSTQTGVVTVTYAGASNTTGTISTTLTLLSTQPAAPFGAFDTPGDGATGLAGSVPVTGWALDDLEVTRVRILRDAIAGEPAGALVYVGDADLVEGARPDVQAQFLGLPRNSRAGWGYLMLTNFLPNRGNGVFRMTAIAEDADGHSTVLGSKTITVANAAATAPFGAIDTPVQGGTVSGTLVNFGWVAGAARRRADPPGGGDVRIVIDGSFLPTRPDGWTSRPDLSTLFPLDLFPGILNALAVAELDTTALTNGVHTIAWVVTDDVGASDGVGSRYFTVANASPPISGSCTPVTTSPVYAGVSAPRSLEGRRGYRSDTPVRTFEAGADGRFTIQSEEVDRVELRLGRGAAGSLRVAGQLRPLPAGSHIDPATGLFTWQPGAGFIGAYDFVLGGRDVRIVLNPKGSNRSGPQLVIDTPRPAYEASDAFIVAGWAADLDSAIDGGVDTVHVWAYPAAGGAPIFIGAAAFGGERPDVAAIYGDRFGKSGYGIQVGGLAPGAYDIAVFAYSTVSGGFAPAKTVRVTVR